jgi:hypothetical protein
VRIQVIWPLWSLASGRPVINPPRASHSHEPTSCIPVFRSSPAISIDQRATLTLSMCCLASQLSIMFGRRFVQLTAPQP